MELGRLHGAVRLQRAIALGNATQVALDIVRIVVIVTALVVALMEDNIQVKSQKHWYSIFRGTIPIKFSRHQFNNNY